jgi:hypothetical protein
MPVEANPLNHVDVFFHLDGCHLPGVHGSYPAGLEATVLETKEIITGNCAGTSCNILSRCEFWHLRRNSDTWMLVGIGHETNRRRAALLNVQIVFLMKRI